MLRSMLPTLNVNSKEDLYGFFEKFRIFQISFFENVFYYKKYLEGEIFPSFAASRNTFVLFPSITLTFEQINTSTFENSAVTLYHVLQSNCRDEVLRTVATVQ